MAGRPFLNVALPATATAAVAVVSYLLYKKTCPSDDYKPAKPVKGPADKRPKSPKPITHSDPTPTPMILTTTPASPQTTPDSSPCESPPLALNDVADSSMSQRIFGKNNEELDISGDEGNNNTWTLERTAEHFDMITDQLNTSYQVVGPRGDVNLDEESVTDIWKNGGDDRPAETASENSVKSVPMVESEEINSISDKIEGILKISTPDVKEEKKIENEVDIWAGNEEKTEKSALLNLELDGLDYNKVEILPAVEAQPVDKNLMANNPFVMEPPEQNASQPLIGAFDSATHSPSEEMLESPCVSNYSDIHSEESSDSGKGGSDINMPAVKVATTSHPIVYEFEIQQDLCGLLIGQQGSTIKFIKNKTQANIYLKRHHYNSRLKLCTITGTQSEVESALQMIRNKFPLNKYPMVTLNQVNPQIPAYDTYLLPDTMQLILPEGIMCDVYLSSLVTANHFFVQQTVHPTYPALSQLTAKMTKCYSKAGTPSVPGTVLPSAICAAPVLGGWYRAQVTHLFNDRECGVKYLDYGGYARVPISSLRQIRGDFLTIPFQASECFLANVKPVNEEAGWSIEAHQVFEELAQGQILQAQVVGYSETGVPFVYLYRRQGALTHFINRELVSRGVALWYDHQV